MIKLYHDTINMRPSLPIPIKLALQDLSNKLGRELPFKWSITKCYGIEAYELTIDDETISFKKDTIDAYSQNEIFDIIYDRIRPNKDTCDENLYSNEIAQAFHDAAADWVYIV